jgi:hypothetical protein
VHFVLQHSTLEAVSDCAALSWDVLDSLPPTQHSTAQQPAHHHANLQLAKGDTPAEAL